MKYSIRLAEETDVIALPEIEKAAAALFAPYLSWLGISADVMEGLTTPRFLHQAQADRRLWVGVVANSPVGFVVVKYLSLCCFVVELDVHPDYGRGGIGSALIETCCQGAKERGFEQVILTTFRRVPWNIPFYERLGFQILPNELWSPEIKAIVQHEARYGFAPEKRAVMRRIVSDAA
ncbi:MAG: GNAT family N-acetyltransferase [Cyanobacteria bacterium P01_D01_bin.105]